MFESRESLRNRLSEPARYILDQLGMGGRVLLYSPTACQLVEPMPTPQKRPDELVDVARVEELRGSGLIRPLAQFRFNNFVGWREIVGERGERFDVYVLML